MDQASSPRRLAFPGDIMDVNLFPSIPGDFRCMRGNLKSLLQRELGISQAAHYPWRFLLKGNRCISVPALMSVFRIALRDQEKSRTAYTVRLLKV